MNSVRMKAAPMNRTDVNSIQHVNFAMYCDESSRSTVVRMPRGFHNFTKEKKHIHAHFYIYDHTWELHTEKLVSILNRRNVFISPLALFYQTGQFISRHVH